MVRHGCSRSLRESEPQYLDLCVWPDRPFVVDTVRRVHILIGHEGFVAFFVFCGELGKGFFSYLCNDSAGKRFIFTKFQECNFITHT